MLRNLKDFGASDSRLRVTHGDSARVCQGPWARGVLAC